MSILDLLGWIRALLVLFPRAELCHLLRIPHGEQLSRYGDATTIWAKVGVVDFVAVSGLYMNPTPTATGAGACGIKLEVKQHNETPLYMDFTI